MLAACVPFYVNAGMYAASALLVGLMAGTYRAARPAYRGDQTGAGLFAFGVHGALWTIVGSSLRQRLTPPEMMGRVASTSLFIAAGGNCVGAVLGGVIAARFGITAPYWAGFVVVAEAYAEPALSGASR